MAAVVTRIRILGIPVDAVSHAALPRAIDGLAGLSDNRQIIFLDMHELMRARHNHERRMALSQAALVIPVSSLLVKAARFLGKEVPPMRRPYSFIIRLLGILEAKNKSVYLLGSTMTGIQQAEATLKVTFPGLQIVGRYSANFPSRRQKDIITAIKKASPALLLAGKGLKRKHLWLSRKRKFFAPGLCIWEESCLDVFSGRKSKPDDSASARLFRGFLSALIRPWRFFRVFRYMLFFFLLLIERIRK